MRKLNYQSGVLTVMVLCLFPTGLSAQNRPQFVWQGQVDGTVILHLAAKDLAVQIQDGAPVEQQMFHFYDFLPQTGQSARVDVLEARGYVHVIDQPAIENHYTLSIEIEDRQQGSSFYSIAVYWDTSNTAFEHGPHKTDQITWKGRVDGSVVISCHQQTCTSAPEQGAPVADEHFKFSRPLPGRYTEVRLEYPEGRGEIQLTEQPRPTNSYTARVSIHDPLPGAGEYAFRLVWDRMTPREAKRSAAIPEPAGRGLFWSGTVDGRIRVTVRGGASFSEVLEGASVQKEHADIVRPLPARGDLMPAIRKLRGRGRVAVIETPSEKNRYQLVFEIDDPEPGADDYEVELDW